MASSRPSVDVSKMYLLVQKIVEENNAKLLSKLTKLVDETVDKAVEPETTHRTFTKAESSAIYRVDIGEEKSVTIAFQSNPSRSYRFLCESDEFCSELKSIISDGSYKDVSMGRLIHKARQSGALISV